MLFVIQEMQSIFIYLYCFLDHIFIYILKRSTDLTCLIFFIFYLFIGRSISRFSHGLMDRVV